MLILTLTLASLSQHPRSTHSLSVVVTGPKPEPEPEPEPKPELEPDPKPLTRSLLCSFSDPHSATCQPLAHSLTGSPSHWLFPLKVSRFDPIAKRKETGRGKREGRFARAEAAAKKAYRQVNTLTYSSSTGFQQGFRMNCFDSFKAARCGQRPIAVDMGPMASTYNSTLARNTHFRSRCLVPHDRK
jgi:hypothetical protein